MVRCIGRIRVSERWRGWQSLCDIEGVDTESDLITADRDFLIAISAQLQATVLEQQRVIERLERRIAELEGQAKPDGPLRMPGLKSSLGRQPPAQQQPSKQRRHGFARPRMTPTHRVEHVVENCPDCATHLSGGWTQRTREVIAVPVVEAEVTEHVYMHRQDLPSVSAALYSSGATGRRGDWGSSVWGSILNQVQDRL